MMRRKPGSRFFQKPAVVFFLMLFRAGWAQEPGAFVENMQRRYESVSTIRGDFEQTYRAPGVEQIESGSFALKKPGLMRWEYRKPEEKLFVADGKEFFLYVPGDRQVTVQPFSLSDMRHTPLEFFFGAADFSASFIPSWDAEFKPKSGGSAMIRLTPRKIQPEYSFLVLELDRKSFEIRGMVVREPGGNTSRFAFTNLAVNGKMKPGDFQFKAPKGVEVVRFAGEGQ